MDSHFTALRPCAALQAWPSQGHGVSVPLTLSAGSQPWDPVWWGRSLWITPWDPASPPRAAQGGEGKLAHPSSAMRAGPGEQGRGVGCHGGGPGAGAGLGGVGGWGRAQRSREALSGPRVTLGAGRGPWEVASCPHPSAFLGTQKPLVLQLTVGEQPVCGATAELVLHMPPVPAVPLPTPLLSPGRQWAGEGGLTEVEQGVQGPLAGPEVGAGLSLRPPL